MDHHFPKAVHIVGTGAYLPEKILTNADLAEMVDTTDEWISTRTGIKERRVAGPDENASDFGIAAARKAMDAAGVCAEDIDMVIASSITPDVPWPNLGCLIQRELGLWNAWCTGIEAACTGFIYALWMARNTLMAGAAKTVLVVASEKMTSIVDWNDRATCVLFGDGASAAVLQADDRAGSGIIDAALGSNGRLHEMLCVPAGGSRLPASEKTIREGLHFIQMRGRETYKHAVTNMAESVQKILTEHGMTSEDVTWLVPHQANLRIIRAVADRLGIPEKKCIITVDKYANTSSSTVGIALDDAVRDGRVKAGDKVILTAFGGGLTWGSMLIIWE